MRAVLGALGVLLGGYGVWLLLSRGRELVEVAAWLAGGVLLHDVVISGTVLLVAAVALRVLPRPARAPAAVGLVVLGSVTLLAIPVLGRFGARADNLTLLDRDYTTGWLVLAVLTMLCVVAATLVRSRRR